MVVDPKFQNRGLGKAMMKYAISQLRSADISNITLFADPQVVKFYQRLGFILDPEGCQEIVDNYEHGKPIRHG